MNLAKQFITSIYKFHDYPKLIHQKGISVILYFIVFTILTTAIILIPFSVVYYKMGGIEAIIEDYVPDFSIENGKLSCPTIDKEVAGIKIYINTEEDFNIDAKAGNSQFYIIANSHDYAINNNAAVTKGSFSEIVKLNKNDIKDFFTSTQFKVTVILTFVFMIIIYEIFNVSFLVILASIINMLLVRSQIKIGGLFKLVIYARTFPILLKIVFALIGMNIPFIIYAGLMITYIYIGLKNIKSANGIIIAEVE